MKNKKTSIGGSALIEGIMMRGPKKMAIAIRKPDGEIHLKVEDLKDNNSIIKKIPILRGCVAFFTSMVTSMKALTYSAEFVDLDAEEPTKFEAWLKEKLGDKVKELVIGLSVVLAIILSVGLFFLIPMAIGELFTLLFKDFPAVSTIRSIAESVSRILIFTGYLFLCTLQNDVKRVFMYHGAEHKTIFAYEAGLPLTVENAKAQSRLHPRCGTSFLVFVMLLSIIVFAFVNLGFGWQRILVKLLLLPVIAGLSFELIKWAGRSDNKCVMILSKPGIWLQNITTKEPTEDMLEIAIKAMEAVIPEEEGEDKW